MYGQSIKQPDRNQWQHQMLPMREIVNFVDHGPNKRVELTLQNLDPLNERSKETLSFDAVILATGYRRDAHVEMLKDCESLSANPSGHWQPGRDYSLALDRSMVEDGANLWLQGCNEGTHGLADSLLSIVSTRGGELVDSIFARDFQLNGH
jgi:L-ornithine N5-oxygenase